MPPMGTILFGEEPLHGGVDPEPSFDFSLLKSKCSDLTGFGDANKSTTAELFVSFLVRYMALTQAWVSGSAEDVRVNTFHGKLEYKAFDRSYIMMVEDPFDSTDNAARTLGTWSRMSDDNGPHQHVAGCFLEAVSAAESLKSEANIRSLLRKLFGNATAASIDFTGVHFEAAEKAQFRPGTNSTVASKGGPAPSAARGQGRRGQGRGREARGSGTGQGRQAPAAGKEGTRGTGRERGRGKGRTPNAVNEAQRANKRDRSAGKQHPRIEISMDELMKEEPVLPRDQRASLSELRDAFSPAAQQPGIVRSCFAEQRIFPSRSSMFLNVHQNSRIVRMALPPRTVPWCRTHLFKHGHRQCRPPL